MKMVSGRQANKPLTNSAEQNGSGRDTEVVIIGAGPTGLMAAGLLARCGVKVRILEKVNHAAKESRAFGVQAKSMELFLNMGIVDSFLKNGTIAGGIQVFVDGHQAGQMDFVDIGHVNSPYSFLFMIPQSEIEKILAEDLAKYGVEIERGVQVEGFEQNDQGVVVFAKRDNGSSIQIRGQYLIGADGAHSVVRKAMGLSFDGAPYHQNFLLADCKIDWPLDYNHIKIFTHGQGLAIYLPLKGKDIGRIVVAKSTNQKPEVEPTDATTSSPISLQEVEQDLQKASNVKVTLSSPVWTSNYRIHHRAVNKYTQGRAFVAGDAAHIHSPAGGQGMNTGLQDAANLAWKIAMVLKKPGSSRLLDTYHSERWPVGQKILKFTDRLFGVVASQSAWLAAVRNTLLPLFAQVITNSDGVRGRAFHFISQLGIRYHENDYVVEAATKAAPSEWRKGLSAGHRAPNALISRHLDVFDLLQGYQFHVLLLSKKSLTPDEISDVRSEMKRLPASVGLPLKFHFIANTLNGFDDKVIRPESSEIFANYGLTDKVPQALYLVRPDGYIGYRADTLNYAGLKDYLARFDY